MGKHSVSVSDRFRQTRRLLGTEGVEGVVNRVRHRGARLLAPVGERPLPVSRADFRRAAEVAAGGYDVPAPLPWTPGEPLTIAWVDVPPSKGSGGQTTIYRMVEALESAGHRCVVYLLDQHGWALEQHRETVATHWPRVRAEIRDVADGIEDAHAVFATCWESAYPVLASPARGARMYFVQDFEPMFYPAGSDYLLAEATYSFGFRGVTAGRWLAEMLERDFGMRTDWFDFGCDVDSYRLDRSAGAPERRTGVSYYCRPSTPRRAHELAVAALDLFAEQHPDVEIHVYGERPGVLSFPVTFHGLLSPAELNDLYNRCVAGLTLSATNVSLVPHEMLAAGCVPVVNDAVHNRVVLDNDHVAYARATPFDLARVLGELVERPVADRSATADAAASSVVGASWESAGWRVEQAVRDAVAAGQPVPDGRG